MSRLVAEVMQHYVSLPRRPTLTLAHRSRLRDAGAAQVVHAGQFARDQVLKSRSYDFVITGTLGCSDFTETYRANVLAKDEDTSQPRRAVIKIPRIADGMSPEAASKRLSVLQLLVKGHAQHLEGLGGLHAVAQVIDCGEYLHRLQDRTTESTFVAYEFIDGLDLATHLIRTYPDAGEFRGLPTASDFAYWARALTKGLLEIHSRNVLHGDIRPENVLVSSTGHPVFVDVGQSLFREVMNSAKAFNDSFYRAPEGITTPSTDLFSLGGLLCYLATGKEPIGLSYRDREALKRQLASHLKEANPRLYHDDAGVVDIIAMCLRNEDRVQHAGQLLHEIEAFWPEASAGGLLDELTSLTAPATALEASGNAVYLAVAVSHARSFRRVLSDMSKGVFDAIGSPGAIRSAAHAVLRPLGAGDQFVTISQPAFWLPENIGINGRFLSMCRNAAARGAVVKRAFLIVDDLSDLHLEEIVAAQLTAAESLDASARPNFEVRYLAMTAEQRRTFIAQGKHFGLLVKDGDAIAMSPVYDANNKLVTLRFRCGNRQVQGLAESFKEIWSKAKPLVDLRFPNRSLDLDVLGRIG